MALGPGGRIGPYEVTALLGKGGMGEVYRATDTNLGREVAIKVLPEAFAQDADRIARFEREAKTLASLNHPNIAAIYGLERSGGMTALVMELVEGPTLAERIAYTPGGPKDPPLRTEEVRAAGRRGGAPPLPVDEALAIAKQIAEALEAAHEKGIIHRDLKPANIKLRPDGVVKVLDFGLAKLSGPNGPNDPNVFSNSPTLSLAATQAGMILGTAGYMSPEQAKGGTVDKRSDVWAFGAVLYEMLTGRRAFDAADVSDTLAAVLMKEPDWAALPATTPPRVTAVLRRCLQKDRTRRARDIGDVALALEGGFEPTSGPVAEPVAVAQPMWRRAATHAATLVLGSLGTGVAVWFAIAPVAPRVARFAITPTGTAAITAIELDRELAITPGGTHVVYVGNSGSQLLVRALDQLDPSPLPGLGQPRGPFLSPDGQWIGFFEGAGSTGTLKKVTITGGPAVALSSFAGARAGGTWGDDGTIVFATTDGESGLWRVSAGGGEPTLLTKPDSTRGEADHLWPEFIAGRQAVLFTIVPTTGDIDAAQVAVLDLDTGTRKTLVQGGSHAHYVSSGHLVYGVAGTLRAVAFDLERLEVIGTPIPVLSQVVTTTAGAANFDIARDGTLVYVVDAGVRAARAPQRTLVWVDRQGHEEPISAPARGYAYPRLSPDGTQVALEIRDQQDDIWVWSFAGQTLTRLTFGAEFERTPAWTPDGRRVVSSQSVGGARVLFWQMGNGTGTPEVLAQSNLVGNVGAVSVSPDGAAVVFSSGAGGSSDVMMLTLGRDRQIQPLVQTQFAERNAEVSPDGRWLAYEANDSGQYQVYVRPFPNVNGGRWQISTAGGTKPLWARSGRELFYLAPAADALMGIRVETGSAWRASTPAMVLEGQYYQGILSRTYDVSLDDKRFLMIKPDPLDQVARTITPIGAVARPAEEGFIVVQNWTEELKRLVPTN